MTFFFKPGPEKGQAFLRLEGVDRKKDRPFFDSAFRIAGELGIPLLTKEVQPIGLATMEQFIAPRPLHTSMSVDRLATLLGRRPRPYQDALRDYLQTYYC